MSTGIDIKFVRETYQRMSNNELIRIATQDAIGLTPEAMEVVAAEIKKRGLDENITKGIAAQNREYSTEEIDAYCDIISHLDCPSCGRSSDKLNATIVGEVVSFILMTQYSKKVKIGCPNCLDKANTKALKKSALVGWWGVPWGIIRTVQAIVLNQKSKRANHSHDHSDYLRAFVLIHVGELETYKSNKMRLQQIITQQNGL